MEKNCDRQIANLAAQKTQQRRSTMKRPILLTTVLLILLSLLSYASTTTAAAASTFSSSSNGYAYAGYATVPVGSSPSTSNSIGPIAQIWLGCNPLATS